MKRFLFLNISFDCPMIMNPGRRMSGGTQNIQREVFVQIKSNQFASNAAFYVTSFKNVNTFAFKIQRKKWWYSLSE